MTHYTTHSFKLSTPEHLTASDRILKVSQLIDFERGTWKQDLIHYHFNPYKAGGFLRYLYRIPRLGTNIFRPIIQLCTWRISLSSKQN